MTDALERAPTGLYIDGTWLASSDGARFDVHDPATGMSIANVASATVEDATAAVEGADAAAMAWRETPPRERADVLIRSYHAMMARRDDIAEIIVREGGKS